MMVYQSLRITKFIIILWLFAFIQSIVAQQGFLSINCCADSKFNDPKTNISWISDELWFPDKRNCLTISRPVLNNTEYDKARIFDIISGKICYNLPTNNNSDYLLRATFLFSDAVRNSDFGVSIGVSVFDFVRFPKSEDLVLEGIFKAKDEITDFCLVTGKGNPYVSQIELRNLVDSEYLIGKNSSVLNVFERFNLGGNESKPDIRYPDDPNDRIWKAKSKFDQNSSFIPTPIRGNIPISNSNASVTVPLLVLQTALTHSDRLEFLHNDLQNGYFNYTIFLYFLEFDEAVQSGQRVFDIYINGVRKYEGFDILANGSNYGEVFVIITAYGSLNLSLVRVPNGSEFGPICNAYEILQEHPWIQETDQIDVNVMKDVSSELLVDNHGNELFVSWSGDPCLPVPWKGLGCDRINGSVVITKLDLMSSKLRGSFPRNITALTHLKELNLSYNGFTGEIPSFPASKKLLSVDVSHNDLMGLIPPSLASLYHLAALYFACNPHLSKELPASFNSSKVTSDYGVCGQGTKHRKSGIIIGTVACGSFLFTVAFSVLVCVYRRKLMYRRTLGGKGFPLTKNAVFSIPSTDDVALKSISIQTFSLEVIEIATQKYKTLVGEGGFGAVYRGTLRDGQEVGVKVRSATSTQGTREFENELNLLSDIRHENLVPLLGYCWEKDQQILVYPFMSNGSLQDRLYGEASKRKILDWPTRLSIALGAARGLTYLHSFAGRCIIHRDVKSSNILLDHSMCAKMADFGFSKYAPQEGDSGASLEVRGTAGYLDPEYYSTQHLSAKSDVFSYGVVLLEIISGREPLNIQRPRNEWSLVEWAKPFIRESKIEEIVDPNIKGGYHAEAMWRVVEVALACIEPFSAYRPSMADIVRELEDAFIIENNASEYMKSIDSMGGYSLGGSNRFSIVLERRIIVPSTSNPTEPSPITSQTMAAVEPR